MVDLRQSLKKLDISIIVLMVVTVVNVFIMVTQRNGEDKANVQISWTNTLQTELDNLSQELVQIEEEMDKTVQDTPALEDDIAKNIMMGTESSIALILDTIEDRKKAFVSLHEKINQINADVSILQNEFSTIEKNLKKEQE